MCPALALSSLIRYVRKDFVVSNERIRRRTQDSVGVGHDTTAVRSHDLTTAEADARAVSSTPLHQNVVLS